MIVISSEANDFSTSLVMDWINHLGKKVLRLNSKDILRINSFELSNHSQTIVNFNKDGETYTSTAIDSFWYRRGYFKLAIELNSLHKLSPLLKEKVDVQLTEEIDSFHNSIYSLLQTKNSLGKYDIANVDKLTVLFMAKDIGIDIPKTIVTTNPYQIETLLAKGEKFITKSICHNLNIHNIFNEKTSETWMTYTESVVPEDIPKESSRIFPSLIQEELDKAFELRIFYLDGDFYSMAIFSQLDPQTKTDFRNYNLKNPNRTTPFKLPEAISTKLNCLMRKLELNTGSIDMVVTKDNRYVFLEVNPVGQFGMVSEPCNYNLEQKIATYLSNHGKHKK
ncbi:grasp-with-spasm system ATP-grasp peptide maturase [Kordia sp.]|uniref:grasp-with-spasm system ATP-grasp peptide maturase n=1 Tax=Kordia sp. TaxID=1965332 RepID=UPI003B595E45